MKHVPAFLFLTIVTAAFSLSSTGHAEPVPEGLLAKARQLKLAESDEWRRLVHYRKSLLGPWTSEADGMNFFVASHGRSEPESELEATIAGFFDTSKRALEGDKEPPQSVRCQFPARFSYLDRQLGLSALVPKQTCAEWDEFRNRVAAKSATLVFSSFYSGSPSSTYGHSLLRLNKSNGADASEHHQLLDSGVNYAALQTTSNPIFYALYGLAGVFRGVFSNVPYYYKVREYGDFESRDLWEYDLDLTPDEVTHLVEHLWELGSTYFDYYYLTENCSYHMLTLVEAAAPRTHLVNRVPFWVIPTDSVKAFFEDGLVRKTNFRASLSTQFEARLRRLNRGEEDELQRLASNDRATEHPSAILPAASFSGEARAKIADAYMDYVDLHYAKQLYKKEDAYTTPKEALLLERSRLPMTPPLDFSTPPVASPHLSHPSARAIVNRIENQNHGGATDFAIRFALHDLADPARGLPDADIDFFHLELRYRDKPQMVRVENAVLFGIGTYQPVDTYRRNLSWRAKLGLQRVDDARCENCLAGGACGGAGYSTSVNVIAQNLIYAMIDTEAFTSPDFKVDKFTLRGGPMLGLRTRFSNSLAWLTEAHYFWSVSQPHFDGYQIDSRLRLVPDGGTWGLDLRGLWKTETREVALGVVHYF